MFILHHQETVLDMGGYNCLGIVNPEKSNKSFYISKIETNVSFMMKISLLSAKIREVGLGKDISDKIKSNIIGKRVKSSAIFYAHPVVKEGVEIIKEIETEKGIPINMVDEELVLKPGLVLVIKAKPAEPNNKIYITVNWVE